MAKITEPVSKPVRIIYTALLSLAGALIALITIGTIFALARSPGAEPIVSLGNQNEEAELFSQNDDIRVFTGIGRLRIPLANSSILILSISFPYSNSDTAFTEELASKITDFRTIASDYFASIPADRINRLDEDTAKTEILRRFNSGLHLGRITAIYFNDLMILD